MFFGKILFVLLIISFVVNAQYSKGDSCHHKETNSAGICVLLKFCQAALADLPKGKNPQLCGFQGLVPIVCCLDNDPKIRITTEAPKPPKPVRKPGEIADQKCWEYSESVYKQIPSLIPFIDRTPLNVSTCTLIKTTLVIGGENSKDQEFPHMALVGFGDRHDIQWKCGGTLISNQFVLTAAHCTYAKLRGKAKYIRLGELNLATNDDADPQDFDIIQMIYHPMRVVPIKYHDIALLKMDRPTKFNEYIRPACLHLTPNIPKNRYIATGWGQTENATLSNHLQKVIIENYSNDQCNASFKSHFGRSLPFGIIPEMQLCAGGKDEEKDTCQGDSGGPLQIYHPKAHCMYSIVGVTSFGKACGIANIPGVYTRVSHYIEWIEQNVWP